MQVSWDLYIVYWCLNLENILGFVEFDFEIPDLLRAYTMQTIPSICDRATKSIGYFR